MHIIISSLPSKLNDFLEMGVYLVKLEGSFGCGVAVVNVNPAMGTQDLLKEC